MDRSADACGILESNDVGSQKDRVVTEEEWLQKWEMGNIGFHKEQGHPLLRKYLDVLLSGRSGLRIFFPLCGKAVEMKWLADMGHRVVGVEVSEQALKEFFSEHSLPYCEEPVPGITGAKKLQSTSGNISLYCCSIYDLSSSIVGKFDGVWDRGALVAVNPCDRQRYVSLMISLMEKNSSYLLVTVSYDPNKHKGPPFYVPETEIKSLFGDCCEIKCLQKVDDFSERHRQWGLDYFLELLLTARYTAGRPWQLAALGAMTAGIQILIPVMLALHHTEELSARGRKLKKGRSQRISTGCRFRKNRGGRPAGRAAPPPGRLSQRRPRLLAAGMAAEDEAELSLLECRVCFEPYGPGGERRPRNLPCGHVLCRGCVGALSGAERRRVECPFCRRACGSAETSDCLPLLQLLEVLGPAADSVPSALGRSGGGEAAGPGPAGLGLRLSLGGWGSLVNPTGVAACRRSGRLVVVHDGKKRIHVFGPSGTCLQRFGERGDAGNDIKYPLDVTVTSDGHMVVTDGGDRAVKAFDFDGRGVLAVREGFCLPWGLDATPEGDVILTDSEAGALYCLTADFKNGKLKKCQMIRSQLTSPRGVAVSQTLGVVAVIEHLKAQGLNSSSTRVKIFSAEMDLVGQMDSFGLNLVSPSKIYTTAVAFDKEGRVIVTDVSSQAVICLGKPEEFPIFNPLISHGLSYPVGLTYTANNSLIVLDSGDHSLKIYSST